MPLRITPVLDLDAPLLKLGGKHDRTKLPDRWVRQKPVPRRAALESAKGNQIPPPPENYPDVVQPAIHLTFVCKENRCD